MLSETQAARDYVQSALAIGGNMRTPKSSAYYEGAIGGFQRENEALTKALAEAVRQAEHVAGRLEQMQDMVRDYRALEAKRAQLRRGRRDDAYEKATGDAAMILPGVRDWILGRLANGYSLYEGEVDGDKGYYVWGVFDLDVQARDVDALRVAGLVEIVPGDVDEVHITAAGRAALGDVGEEDAP